MKELPHNTNIEEMTNMIYDTLMRNTKNTQLDTDFIEMPEVTAKDGYIEFWYNTERGDKRIYITVSIEDAEDNDE